MGSLAGSGTAVRHRLRPLSAATFGSAFTFWQERRFAVRISSVQPVFLPASQTAFLQSCAQTPTVMPLSRKNASSGFANRSLTGASG